MGFFRKCIHEVKEYPFSFRGFYFVSNRRLRPFKKDGARKMPRVMLTRWKRDRRAWGPFGFYYDAENAFVLMVGGEAVACISFSVYRDGSAVYIEQIQGKTGKADLLSLLRWERFLVSFVTRWAKKRGFSEACVQAAKNNKYYNKDRHSTFRLRYDVTATRLGFRYEAGRHCFVKVLKDQNILVAP